MGAMTHLHFSARLLVRWAACLPAQDAPNQHSGQYGRKYRSCLSEKDTFVQK